MKFRRTAISYCEVDEPSRATDSKSEYEIWRPGESLRHSHNRGMMTDMSNLVRIINAGVPGSDRRVDIVLGDGTVVDVKPTSASASTFTSTATTASTTSSTATGDSAGRGADSPLAGLPHTMPHGMNPDDASEQTADITTIDADGLWVIPGLWDCHTHFTQWAKTLGRLDLIDARSAAEAMSMLRAHLDERRAAGTLNPDAFVVGMRFRHSLWADDEQPTLAAIDAASGEQPVALSSADMHCGWVNSAAARRLGVHPDEQTGLVGELEWFNTYTQFDSVPGAAEETDRLLREAEKDAAGKGIVGIRDYEMAENINTWIARFSAGIDGLRVDAGVYPERLREAIDAGWHTGDPLPGSHGLGRVGAMKLIADGSLNTRSAYCSTPYSGIEPPTYGVLSYTPQQIEDYMRLATEHGFDIACHAIGDEANTIVLNAAKAAHAHGSIEHAQMLKPRDIPRLAALGLDASIQPQHAMDDRDVIARFWAHPAGVPYPFRALADTMAEARKDAEAHRDAAATAAPHGSRYGLARLRMGSDAPVAPLDPWLAISAAVFATESSDREPFQPEQRLTAHMSLAASTATGRDHLCTGDPADVVLLDANPYAVSTPEAMRAMPNHVVMTLVNGNRVY